MNGGSVWRKWDLHIHTPASFQDEFKFVDTEERHKYGNDMWEKFIDELEKVSAVSVIGVTDYFTVEGYKKVLEYKKNGRVQNFELILPNIEFRLDKFVGGRRLNYHIIFSDELETHKIEKEFLEELHVTAPNAERRKLNKTNIEEIGRILKEHQENFRRKSDYVVGCGNITVSLDEMIETLKSKESVFGGKYVLVLPEEGWCLIDDWRGQDHLTRKEMLVRSHTIFSSNPNTRDWALGKKHPSPKDFINEFSSLKPCIHGSDAHCFERLCKPDEDRFCWIKADPCFEGLKQIIYEPDERVRIQPEHPEHRKNIYTLNSIQVRNSWISDELSIREQSALLNRNLVAVTGGKGSGKTALLDFIANCFEDRCRRAGHDKNSFVQRIEVQKPDLEVTIGFIGEDVEQFSKVLTKEEFFQDSRITYLPQGKIEEYSGDREKLDRKIEEIIFNNKEVIERGYKQEFDRLRNEIGQLIKDIEEVNRTICDLEEETKQDVISGIESRKGIKDGELKNKKDELRKLTGSMEKDIEERIANIKKEEVQLRVKHSKFEDVKDRLEQFKSELEEFLDISNQSTDDLNRDLCELGVKISIPRLSFKPQVDSIKKALTLVDEGTKNITEEIKKRQEVLNQLTGDEKAHAELLKEIEGISNDIESLEKELKELERKKGEIKSLEKDRKAKYQNLLNKYWEWKKYYEEVINAFTRGKSEIMSGIDFESSIYFDKDRFVELGSDILDLRRTNIDEIEKHAVELGLIGSETPLEELEWRLDEFIKKIFKRKQLLRGTRTSYDFYKWVFGNYFSLSTEILFKGRLMEKLSMGQKGTVLLKLFLAEGDYPLIVDQPEESLDNKFIYDELVGAFREAKKKRQVIIATNNANLVVNTDAEEIIVAEFEDNRISYKSGTLEDLKLREDIVPILEGGKEAFRKREEKYGI